MYRRALNSLVEGLTTHKPIRDYIDFPPLSAKQTHILQHPARFKVLNGGRRGGKTSTAIDGSLEDASEGRRVWYSALTYKNVQNVWRELVKRTRRVPGIEVSKSLMELRFPNGGYIGVRSLQEPDNLRGDGLDRHYIDEYAFVHPDAYPLVLEPMLLERKGGAWFMSSPNGMNHHYALYNKATSGLDLEYGAFKLTAYDNPIVDHAELERIKANVPEHVWLQEYLGEFLPDGGAVFRNVRSCATAAVLDKPIPGHQYIIAGDLAKVNDFSWFMVGDVTTKEVVNTAQRFNQIDYTIQLDRLEALCKVWTPIAVILESNIEKMLIEQAQRRGLPVIPFQTTQGTKQVIIDNLALGFEQGAFKIPADETLIGELQAYQIDKTPSGLVKYGAPPGLHDDGVMALALWWYYAYQMGESTSWVG